MFDYENNLLVIDELYFDPRYPTNPVVRIGESYYMLPNNIKKPIHVNELRPFKTTPAVTSRKATYDNEFYFLHTMPRDGFKVPVGRAATPEEFEKIVEEYGLGEEDISKEFDDKKGMLYGEKYAKSYKSRQIRVPELEAIPLEQKLQDQGIEASNGSPGRVNIRTEWGGPREGAGRPSTGRKKRNFYITDEEHEKLTDYLKTIRPGD